MTYGECKDKIRDLGFEENSTMAEYSSIVRNAVHRAVQFIYDDVVIKLKGYYKQALSTEDMEWTAVRPTAITIDTLDNFVIELPDNLVELVPLLASYYVWLDDDQVKAALYWNSFDSHKQDIINGCLRDIKGKITGGVRW